MRKIVLLSALALGAFGCSHTVDQARADYHQNRAESAAAHGNYYKAAKQEHKAQRDQAKADYAPLP